ncbi:zinc finger protein, partial [Oryctes borbonicus]
DLDSNDETNCMWLDCNYTATSLVVLAKHVCFHGYHLRLRNIGENVLERVKLPKCTQITPLVVPNIDYNCEWENCGHSFLAVQDFHDHIKLHVNSNPKYCKKGEFIECYWAGCKFKFTSQYKLADHMRTHTKERVIACPTCGKMFATKTKFYDHRKRQLPLELQSYQCSQCSKLFPSERLLRDHMRSHINHYKCSMCDMTCPKPSILAQHIKYRHLNERPYKCNLCEHASVTKANLEQHLTTHCVEKLMICDECNFRCRSLYGLDRHYQTVHGQGCSQLYECHCCQSRFSRGNYLTRHLIKVHDFHWPSGHSRFRYKEDNDGIFRLQTVRYESLEVTQEMMRGNKCPPLPNSVKYNIKQEENSKIPSYVLMICETGEENVVCSSDKKIAITIDDLDEKGNVVRSETVESNEIIRAPENVRCLRSRSQSSK